MEKVYYMDVFISRFIGSFVNYTLQKDTVSIDV